MTLYLSFLIEALDIWGSTRKSPESKAFLFKEVKR